MKYGKLYLGMNRNMKIKEIMRFWMKKRNLKGKLVNSKMMQCIHQKLIIVIQEVIEITKDSEYNQQIMEVDLISTIEVVLKSCEKSI